MLRLAAGFAALALIWSSPAAAFGSGGMASDVAARAKVMRFLGEKLGVTEADRDTVTIDLVDLNADGVPEALATVSGRGRCGVRGCGYILDLGSRGATALSNDASGRASARTTRTNGWRDVTIGGRTMAFGNGRYEP